MSGTTSIKCFAVALALTGYSTLALADPEVTSVSFHDATGAPVSVALDHYVAVGTFNMAPTIF